mmetsp:Transcript_66569/g.105327  ORF Transcript_66569/g.105327 Transcript_66569/m.105327 type:complete len:158 (-) Transcript_66569:7-480(-)
MGATACCCAADKKGDDNAVVVNANISRDEGGEKVVTKDVEALDKLAASIQAQETVEEERKQVEGAKRVKLVFEDDDGRERIVNVEHQPLGLLFDKELPIKITEFKASSYGKDIGVEMNWVLVSVNGESLKNCSTFEDALALMQKHIRPLPPVPVSKS